MNNIDDVLSKEEQKSAREDIMGIINTTEDSFNAYEEIEDMLLYDYGIEADYLFDLL